MLNHLLQYPWEVLHIPIVWARPQGRGLRCRAWNSYGIQAAAPQGRVLQHQRGMPHGWGIPGPFLWAEQGSQATTGRGRHAGEEMHRAGGGAGWEKMQWRNGVCVQDGHQEHTGTSLLMAPCSVCRHWDNLGLISSAACQGNGGSLPDRAVLD